MTYSFEPMDAEGFAETESWRYPPPYDFYDGDVDPVLNPERHFAARDEGGEIVGFLYFEERGPRLEFGLGLRPDLVGRGLGEEFLRAGLEFGRERLAHLLRELDHRTSSMSTNGTTPQRAKVRLCSPTTRNPARS